jgi:hypothetical protein
MVVLRLPALLSSLLMYNLIFSLQHIAQAYQAVLGSENVVDLGYQLNQGHIVVS